MLERRTTKAFAALLATGVLLGATAGRAGEDEHGHEGADAEQELHVSAEQQRALGIEVAPVGPGRVDAGLELLGEVHPNGDKLAHMVPRFPGIVREVRRTAGDRVRSGDVLAVIESSESLAPYELRTLIDGVVLSRHLTRGEAVDREKEAFVVADLSTVWVDLNVYQKDLGRVRIGQQVLLHAVQGGPDATGTIAYLTPVVDQLTRAATARVVLPNPDARWLPGMFVTGHALEDGELRAVVPRAAIQTLDGASAVFVAGEDGFAARSVVLGREGDTLVEVASGLAPGERIAVTNSFLLKAELARAEAEHQH